MNLLKPFFAFGRRFPLRRNALLLSVVLWVFYRLYRAAARPQAAGEADSFRPILETTLLLAITLLSITAVVSILPATLAWLRARSLRKKTLIQLTVGAREQDEEATRLPVQITVPESFRLFWGSLRLRLRFRDESFSNEMVLRGFRYGLRPAAAVGETHFLQLPYVQQYAVSGLWLRFRDAFGLVEWPLEWPASALAVKYPERLWDAGIQIKPAMARELTVRVEKMQRTQGELYNQKVFEAGDDMRRILWKQYARNRELAVRIPERFEPYASEQQLYISFGASPLPLPQAGYEDGPREMLSYYKSVVWTLYEDLKREGQKPVVKLDQLPPGGENTAGTETFPEQVAGCEWRYDSPALPQGLYTLCLSSMHSAAAVQQLLGNLPSFKTPVLYVLLSRSADEISAPPLWQKLLIRPDKRAAQQDFRRRLMLKELQAREAATIAWLNTQFESVTVV